MSGADDPDRSVSGASLGLGPSADDAGDTGPLDVPEHERYSDGGLLGRGGMGEVRAARDRRLDRTVAVKAAMRGDAGAAARLLQEATVTARLTHPGIVPVHDAGRGPDGRPYYTMPIVRGRSLAEAATGASTGERLRLVRHVLDAARAIAYANAAGVLHRDLKPANLLVGPFGETLVVDWGLAAPVGEPSRTRDGRAVGTPAYMPPEQERGEALDARADVYGLGATLYDLLAGRPPGRAPGPVRDVAPGVPAELAAIVDRALAALPGDRYPDARALAEDLDAWFDGRRVAAHRYSMRELVVRYVHARRVSFTIAAAAALALAMLGALSVQRTREERDAAQAAEHRAVTARRQAEENLALAEIAQALDAADSGDQAAAEILAATALTTLESPEARGVLAGFDARARPRNTTRVRLPDCTSVAISGDGGYVACLVDDQIRVYAPDAPTPLVGQLSSRTDTLGISPLGPTLLVHEPDSEHTLITLDGVVRLTAGRRAETIVDASAAAGVLTARTGGSTVVFDVAGGRAWLDHTCDHVPATWRDGTGWARGTDAVAVAADGTMVVACGNMALLRTRAQPGAPTVPFLRLDPADGAVQIVAVSSFGRPVAAFRTAAGRVRVVDLADARVLLDVPDAPHRDGLLAVSGSRVAIGGSTGVEILDIATGARVARLPGYQPRLAWLDDGTRLRTVRARVEDWALPAAAPWPARHPGASGVTSLAVAPDGGLVAAGTGSGVVRFIRPDRPSDDATAQLHGSVVKDLAFSPDGRAVAIQYATAPEIFLVSTTPDRTLFARLPARAGRRMAWLAGGLLATAPYGGGLLTWHPPDDVAPVLVGDARGDGMVDLEADADRVTAVAVDADGQPWRLTDGRPPVLTPLPSERVAAGASGGGRTFTVSEDTLSCIAGPCTRRSVHVPGALPVDVAVSPDGRLVAIAARDGTVRVLDAEAMETRAVLAAHRTNVAAVVFDPTSAWLFSGSWDGEVRAWSMGTLVLPATELRAATEAAWGRTFRDVLPAHRDGDPG